VVGVCAAAKVSELVNRRQSERRNILENFEDLAQDLRETCGGDGPLISSTQMRALRRSDLAKASTCLCRTYDSTHSP